MGDLRDQMNKIKSALGLGDAVEKKEPLSKKKPLPKPVEVTIKKNRSSSLPKVSSQHEPQAKIVTPSKQQQPQAFNIKTQPQVNRLPSVQSPPQRPTISNESTSGVTISRTVAPTALASTTPVIAPVPPRSGQLTLPSFTTLTRTSEFKVPDAWVARGKSSQLTTQASGRRSDIFIGLDFGTAFTKAAVQISDKIYPVDWNGIANLKEKFLLPTEYSELPSKECFLGQHPNSSPIGLHANLKHLFIIQRVTDVSLAKASVFVALVLQYIRAWVYHHHGDKLGSVSIGWYLNIGIPSDVLDQDQHAHQYKKLADIAWEISLLPHLDITYEKAFQYLGQPIKHDLDLREVSPVPELVAQLAGYSKTSRRQNGLHALVDIGGGTVDMVTFNVHQADGDDVFPFFVANVKPLGSYALLENRFLNLPIQTSTMSLDVQELLTAEAFAKFFRAAVRSVQDVDKKFFKQFQGEFESVLRTTHRRRYPSSPNWQTGIRTFICGGGAFIQGYVESIRTSYRPSNCPLHTMELPPHQKLANFDQDPAKYNRISVACGLAMDELSLGAIRPASEVDDATPLITTVNGLPIRERPDRDELYPK